ncbi:piggyBac transposable element-derived protein 4-like [Macrobrachium nipponense]|uniref:piggyBac transposable element-derived protein 4-like n=1 Tax=Macrobrachium nipponense TaxID=159736 RepID=UPI0030C8336B
MANRRSLNEEEIWGVFESLPSDPVSPFSDLDEEEAFQDHEDEDSSSDEIINEEMDMSVPESDEDSDDEVSENIPTGIWEPYNEAAHVLPNFDYTGSQEFLCPNTSIKYPIDFFHLFFTVELLTTITLETNRYTEEKINRKRPLPQHSIWHDWVPFTVEEMEAFRGVLLYMAIKRKSTLKDFFSGQWLDSSTFPRQIFSKKRFLQLFWGLHVSPPCQSPSNPIVCRKAKVNNVVNYLNGKFLEFYRPSSNLSADESTVPFKGRSACKMYEP